MAVIKNKTNNAGREYWSHIEEVAKGVGEWPPWMGNRKDDSKDNAKSESVSVRGVKAKGASASK